MPRIEITKDTPFEDVKSSRRNTIKLAQLVLDRQDTDFYRAMTQFGKTPQLGQIIEAKREGSFHFDQLFLHGPMGPTFPPADVVLAILDDTDVTPDSDSWKALVKSLDLGEGFKLYDGTELTSEDQLFEAVFGKSKPKKRKTSRKKKAATEEAPPRNREDCDASSLAVEPEETIPMPPSQEGGISGDGILEMIAGGLEALDKRILDRLDTSDEELKAGLEALNSHMHERMDMVFGALQLLANVSLVTYRRQMELDVLIDPNGEFPEISEEVEQELEALVSFGQEFEDDDTPADEAEQEEPVEDAGQGESDEEAPVTAPEETPADDLKDQKSGQADGGVLEITREMKKLSLDEFLAALNSHESVSIPDFPEGKSILSALSAEKLRELAEYVGVENAKSLNYKMLIIARIGAHLGIDRS